MTEQEIAAVVDELGDLDKTLAPHRNKIAREEKLRKLLREVTAGADENVEIKANGVRYYAVLGVRTFERVILSKAKLFKAISAATFKRLAEVPFNKLDTVITEAEQEAKGISGRKQTGYRPLHVYEKPADNQKAA